MCNTANCEDLNRCCLLYVAQADDRYYYIREKEQGWNKNIIITHRSATNLLNVILLALPITPRPKRSWEQSGNIAFG